MPPAATWIKMSAAGLALAVGGPALVYYVSPTEEELFKRYNPELQRRSLEGRIARQEEFDTFVKHLKDYSKSDQHIWLAAEEAANKRREEEALKKKMDRSAIADEMKKQRQEMAASISEETKASSDPPKKGGGWWA